MFFFKETGELPRILSEAKNREGCKRVCLDVKPYNSDTATCLHVRLICLMAEEISLLSLYVYWQECMEAQKGSRA